MVIVSNALIYFVSALRGPGFSERAKNVWLDTGANWDESVKGTNAIGTAIFEKKTDQCRGGRTLL